MKKADKAEEKIARNETMSKKEKEAFKSNLQVAKNIRKKQAKNIAVSAVPIMSPVTSGIAAFQKPLNIPTHPVIVQPQMPKTPFLGARRLQMDDL